MSTINSQKVLYNKIGDDENYTPKEGVTPILKYITLYADKNGYTIENPLIVWCPFDLSTSFFVTEIGNLANNVKVTYSHIKYLGILRSLKWSTIPKSNNLLSLQYQYKVLSGISLNTIDLSEGRDFFTYEPEHWDIIISNPPFKNKRKFFERALSFNKPFALIMTNAWLNDSGSKTVFSEVDKQLQLLMFNDRMKFTNPYGRPNNKITFSSSYFCYNFLPNDLILGGKLK